MNRTDLNASILAEMLLVQSVHLEGQGTFTPWFLESEMSSASTVIDEERVPLPLDFLCAIEDEPLWLYDTTATPVWAKLGKTSVGLLTERYTAPCAVMFHARTSESASGIVKLAGRPIFGVSGPPVVQRSPRSAICSR